MRIFKPGIQTVLRILTIAALMGMIVLPVAWGYEQRRQARTWQAVACEYRVREIVRRVPLVASIAHAGDPCAALHKLGFDIDRRR
ncbi:MAG: hypothetical protein ACREM3_20720 [Candidatus Rokuibacteriota bacterium]